MKKVKQYKISVLSVFVLIAFSGLGENDINSYSCPNIIVSGTNASCYGSSDGTAMVAVSGGSGSYTINWSNGANINSINGLPVGTYTVSVKDNSSGCSVVGAYVVDAPDPVSVSETITQVTCHGQNTGGISISVTGGSGGYGYEWKNSNSITVSTNQNLVGAPAGTYTLKVNDFRNCSFSKTYTITQPAEPLTSSSVITNASCFGLNTGKIDFEVWGGTPSYTYLWNTGHNTQDINNLTEGNYSVTVTDFKGCTLPVSFYVGQPAILATTVSATDVLCFGDQNGSIQASVTGGTTPYSYSWQNSLTVYSVDSPLLNNVPSDNYQVTVTDSKGCKNTTGAVVNQPSELILSYSHVNVSCYGGTDGSIDVSAFGGTPAYDYSWSDGSSTIATSQDITLLSAGIYTLVVTDQNSCSKTITQEITQPLLPISVTENVIDVKCFGNNTGEIGLTVLGGTSPYSYSWTTGQSASHITGLIAMTYNYVVVDSKMCTYSNSVIVSQPSQPLTVTNTITNVNCYGESNGAIDLTVTGGTFPYAYKWNNSQYNLSVTNQDLTGYPAESYTYLVTDANNCTETTTLTIVQPTKLQSTVSGVNILCKGGNNGSINLTVTGGVMPYQYSWNNSIVTEDQSNLTAGYYEVLITDNHNCTLTNNIVLTEPQDSLSFTFSVENVKCNNGQDGSIEISVAGGTIPYSYSWSNGDTQAKTNRLTAGYYGFVATDNNGCTISNSIFVSQPDPLLLNEQITDVTCFGLSDGEIDITPTGGTAPYKYTWLNSDYVLSTQEEDLIDFPADIYQLEVLDSNNCFYEIFLTLPQPDILVATYTTDIVSCSGGANGNVFVTITGGNPSYITTWSNGANTQDLLNIPAGQYELNVIDQKGCSDSFTVDITEPLPITVSFETTEVSCVDQHDGTALAIAEGGNGGYFYNWSNGSNSALAEGLNSETYSVVVVDVLGCTGTADVLIPKSMSGCINPVTAFTPNGDAYNDTWVIDNMHLYPDAELTIFNKWGTIVYKHKGLYTDWDGRINGVDLPSEVYYYIINLNFPEREPLTGNITIIR